MAAYSRMRIKPIMSLDRELQMSSGSRWAPIASLRISRLGSAAMAPPEGPPRPFWRGGRLSLCEAGTSTQPHPNCWQKAKALPACGQSKKRAPARDE
jgi:hypothetical protein